MQRNKVGMEHVREPRLYLISTPIGNLGDITMRALEVLKQVEIILCEDTRVTHKLLQAYSLPKKSLWTYNDNTAKNILPKVMQALKQGKCLALLSDAGTPLVSDPGYKLVQACIEQDIVATLIPGPSAVLTALVLSGLPPEPFAFLGFFEEQKFLTFQDFQGTLVFFESPHRLIATLEKLRKACHQRACVIARELTKHFEEVIRGSFDDILNLLSNRGKIKGEIVVLLGPPCFGEDKTDEDILEALRPLLDALPLKEAAMRVSQALGVNKRRVYQLALQIR